MRVLLPVEVKEIHVSDASGSPMELISTEWDEKSKTCFLSFMNQPEGVSVELSW